MDIFSPQPPAPHHPIFTMAPGAGVTLCLCPELQRNALGEVLRTAAEGGRGRGSNEMGDFPAMFDYWRVAFEILKLSWPMGEIILCPRH